MDDNKIVITDNNGEENVFEILFTYEDEENGNKYVMYYSEEDDEQIFASRYDDDNHLYDIEDPAEWERLEEVLEDFNMHDEKKQMINVMAVYAKMGTASQIVLNVIRTR